MVTEVSRQEVSVINFKSKSEKHAEIGLAGCYDLFRKRNSWIPHRQLGLSIRRKGANRNWGAAPKERAQVKAYNRRDKLFLPRELKIKKKTLDPPRC